MLYDTHYHLDLAKSPEQMVRQIEESRIYTIAVTNLPGTFSHTNKLCEGANYVRPALGYHPELVAKYPGQLDQFTALLPNTRYIGEIGLDNARKSTEDYQKQKKIFEQIVAICASSGDKILSVHSRRAERDVTDIIGMNFPGKVILHWFSGTIKQMELAADRGCYFSVNLTMTTSENGRRLIAAFPPDRILLETDGPFTVFENAPCSPIITSKIAKEIMVIKSNLNVDLSRNFKALLA